MECFPDGYPKDDARGNAAIKKMQEQGAKAPEAVRSVRKGTVR